MQIVSRRTLKTFWELHPQAEQPLARWLATVAKARWRSPADIEADFGTTVDFVGDNRVVFDVAGNKYRLIVHVAYEFKSIHVSLPERTASMTESIRRRSDGRKAYSGRSGL